MFTTTRRLHSRPQRCSKTLVVSRILRRASSIDRYLQLNIAMSPAASVARCFRHDSGRRGLCLGKSTARYPYEESAPSRLSNFGSALDSRLSLGLGRRATPEPADHTDCRQADDTAPQPSRLTGPGMIRFEQFAISVRRRRRDGRSRAFPSLRSRNPTADVAERL
jgi:hypothetical protein